MSEVRRSIDALRKDAIERNLLEVAIVYGWSAMRLQEQEIERNLARLKK